MLGALLYGRGSFQKSDLIGLRSLFLVIFSYIRFCPEVWGIKSPKAMTADDFVGYSYHTDWCNIPVAALDHSLTTME